MWPLLSRPGREDVTAERMIAIARSDQARAGYLIPALLRTTRRVELGCLIFTCTISLASRKIHSSTSCCRTATAS